MCDISKSWVGWNIDELFDRAVRAYGLGYYDARTALNSKAGQTLLTTDGQMNGQVFRSGERGILFFDAATKKVNFLRWDEVKRLEATVNGPL
jgi:hypothetical protein